MDEDRLPLESLKPPQTPVLISETTEPLWTVEDVARYLRLEVATVRAMAREGKLPAIKVGRAWRFKKGMMEQYIQNQQK